MIRLMGSVLMEIHEKWMTGKNSFTMECYEADKEEARKAVQLDSNELNHTDQLTARPDPYRKLNLHQHYGLDSEGRFSAHATGLSFPRRRESILLHLGLQCFV
ncbi:MAG TPA: hypothetical protein VF370_05965 [Candidatus Cryosericum sp.]